MSYILEALKKADAEREQGHVPGLHSQAWTPSLQATAGRTRSRGVWLAIGLLLLLAAVGLGGWIWRGTASPEPAVLAQRPDAAAAAVVPMVAPPPAASHPMVPVAPAVSPAPVAPAVAALAPAPASNPAPKPKLAKAQTLGSPASAADRVVKWADMTSIQRQAVAKLTWGGAMHSTDPSARMVIVNDQVMREGDALGPDLVVERIEPKAVILNLQGQRIRKDF